MSEYTTDEEQVEKLKHWWSDNQWFVITGLVAGATVLFGYNWYKNMVQTRAQTASALYADLKESVVGKNTEAALQQAAKLKADFSATPYDAQSGLALAKLHMDNGDTDAAISALKDTIARGGPELVHVARLRLAKVLISAGQAEQAKTVLTVKKQGEFAPLYQETLGDVLVALGDTGGAIEQYKLAMDHDIPLGDTQFLQIKLQNLGASID